MPSLELSTASRTDVGRVRSRNEDAHTVRSDLGLVVVADGMGGHPAGDVASRLAVEALVGAWAEEGFPVGEGRPDPGEIEPLGTGARMAASVRHADDRVRAEGDRDPALAGMGTTLTALHLDTDSGRWTIGHVGDSRAYLWRGGELSQLTGDHTWVQQQVESGRLSSDQARSHPWSSVLSRCIGVTEPAEPDVLEGDSRAGDVFLLCTDGLVAMLRDEEIAAILHGRLSAGLESVADALVDSANERGGLDNVTVALVAVGPLAAASDVDEECTRPREDPVVPASAEDAEAA